MTDERWDLFCTVIWCVCFESTHYRWEQRL